MKRESFSAGLSTLQTGHTEGEGAEGGSVGRNIQVPGLDEGLETHHKLLHFVAA